VVPSHAASTAASLTRWAQRVRDAAVEAAWLGTTLPRHVRRLISNLESGNLEVAMRPAGIEEVVQRLERLVNRLVFGILAAAFIVGIAVLLAFSRPDALERWVEPLVLTGFGAALILVILVGWSVVRSRRG
jgi:hypothetical protein